MASYHSVVFVESLPQRRRLLIPLPLLAFLSLFEEYLLLIVLRNEGRITLLLRLTSRLMNSSFKLLLRGFAPN